jgi:glutaredoxin 3
MAKVVVYTTPYCPFCLRAKLLLKNKDVAFEEVDVSDDALREELVARTHWRTVPQIFVGEEFVGGYDELQALEDDGKLDPMLAA